MLKERNDRILRVEQSRETVAKINKRAPILENNAVTLFHKKFFEGLSFICVSVKNYYIDHLSLISTWKLREYSRKLSVIMYNLKHTMDFSTYEAVVSLLFSKVLFQVFQLPMD